ncbi:unnamed protein product [Alternaria alternata]
MKFATTILTLALAALTMATPLANPSPVADPVAAPQVTPPPVDKPNCRDCDNNFTKCRLLLMSWVNVPSILFDSTITIMKLTLVTLSAVVASTTTASPLVLEPRQQCSTSWSYPYTGRAPPGNYKAFNLASCTVQLSFNKDQYVGVQWAFEATYADGSRAELKPFRDFNSFGVSDTFYPYLGNNFLTRYLGNSAFTAVHEFSSVCKNGQAPISWRFYTTSGTANGCYTTGQIQAVGGVSRPAKVTGVSLRRNNDAGDFEVAWSPVSRAVADPADVDYLDRVFSHALNTVNKIRTGSQKPPSATRLRLYGLYKQAMVAELEFVWDQVKSNVPSSSSSSPLRTADHTTPGYTSQHELGQSGRAAMNTSADMDQDTPGQMRGQEQRDIPLRVKSPMSQSEEELEEEEAEIDRGEVFVDAPDSQYNPTSYPDDDQPELEDAGVQTDLQQLIRAEPIPIQTPTPAPRNRGMGVLGKPIQMNIPGLGGTPAAGNAAAAAAASKESPRNPPQTRSGESVWSSR